MANRWFFVSALALGVVACGGAASKRTSVDVTTLRPLTPSATAAAAPVPVEPALPHGKGGWFEELDAGLFDTVRLSSGSCTATQQQRRWLVTPNAAVSFAPENPPNACDGDAVELPPLPFSVDGAPLRWPTSTAPDRLVFVGSVSGHGSASLLIADAPEAVSAPIDLPDGGAAKVAAAGAVLLATAQRDSLLYRLDGKRWTAITLDGGTVVALESAREGAFVVTSKQALYESRDGVKWTKRTTKLRVIDSLGRIGSTLYAVGPSDVRRGPEEAMVDVGEVDDGPYRSKLRFAKPTGVTTLDGEPLAAAFMTTLRLTAGRRCVDSMVHDKLSVAACNDEQGFSVVASTDGGESIVEAWREPEPQSSELAVGAGEILLLRDCSPLGCAHAGVLSKGTDGWRMQALDLPAGAIAFPIFDRRTGFYFVRAPAPDAPPATPVEVYHFARGQLAHRPLSTGPAWPMAASVGDDGDLRLVVGTRDDVHYVHWSERSSEEHPIHEAKTPGLTFAAGSTAVVGAQIFCVVDGRLFVSENEGATFRAFPVSDAGGSLRCGTSGCDVQTRSDVTLMIRWGDESPEAVLDRSP